MKLIIAIVSDTDNEKVSHALTSENFKVTFIASTGGFLRKGNSTFLIGLEDDRLDTALKLIKDNCTPPASEKEKRGVIFVLNVNEYIHI